MLSEGLEPSRKKHWFLKPACLPIPPEEQTDAPEREGFEPSVALATTVFKTVAIDHSATFPAGADNVTRTRDSDLGKVELYH